MKKQYYKFISSIAFLPALTALLFLFLSWLLLEFDYSETGKSLKTQWQWLRLKDASTARSIISTIAAGIISLTVFSFSMVMIVLNQAASQLSNRVLDKLIGNRFQQVVLGFYIGTIVYALFLLSTIRDIDAGVYVPAISTYLLIFFTVWDIFLFIYFLHYITQSVKYETIIQRIYRQTEEALATSCMNKTQTAATIPVGEGIAIKAAASGIYQGFDQNDLLELCQQHDLQLTFIYPPTTFVLKGTPLLLAVNQQTMSKKLEGQIQQTINLDNTETILTNYFYGFRQLMEVAVKALSPGINDPGTAVISLHALADLLAYRAQHFPEVLVKDEAGGVRITVKEKTFDEIFSECILPIWDYGKEDRVMRHAMMQVLRQLQAFSDSTVLQQLLRTIQTSLN
ncbi:MAG: DUF2254 domain-containing protein [Adhaeribacter sp.]